MTGTDGAGGQALNEARRLHPASPLVDLLVTLPRMWPLLIIVVSASWRAVTIGGLIVGVVVVTRVIAWWRTSYSFDGRELTVSRGLLNRSVRRVPAARIQQVEVVRKLRHQILGVSMLRVQLADAGSDQGDVELDVLSQRDADALRTALEQSRRSSVGADATASSITGTLPPPPVATTDILRLSAPLLALGGVTGASLLFVPAGIGALAGGLDDTGLVDDAGSLARRLSVDSGLTLVIVAVAVFSFVIAAAISVVRNHGFVLRRSGDDLIVQRGLFEQRVSTVPLARVQVVHVRRNFIRSRLGLASVTASTSGRIAAESNSASGSVPVARWEDAVAVAAVALGGRLIPEADRRYAPAARRRLLRATVIKALLVTGWMPFAFAGVWVLVVATVTALALGSALLSARARRHGIGSEVVVVESGVFVWSRAIVPIDRIQSWRAIQNPLQRRHGLYDVVLQLSGARVVRIVDASAAQMTDLIDAVAGRETDVSNWAVALRVPA